MADPVKYVPDYSFANFQAGSPADPLPADRLDTELENIQQTTDELVDAVKDVRRADGALKNGIVTLDSLADEVAIGLGPTAVAAAEAAETAQEAAEGARDTAVAAKDAALAAKADAEAAKTDAENLVGAAVGSIEAAGVAGVAAVNSAKDDALDDVSAAQASSTAAIDTAKDDALAAVGTAQTAGVAAVNTAKDAAIDSVNTLGDAKVEAADDVLSDFKTRYLGAFAAAPTTDNEGGAIVEGALYFHTGSSPGMRTRFGGVWVDAFIPAEGYASTGYVDSAVSAVQDQIDGEIDDRLTALEAADDDATADITTLEADVTDLDTRLDAVESGKAPASADYLVKTASPGLSAERVVTDGTGDGGITWDWATAGVVKAVIGDAAVATTKIKDAAVTFAKLAGAAVSTAAEILSNTASKLISVQSLWSAAAVVDLGNVTGTVTIDANTGVSFRCVAIGNVTFAKPTNLKDGQSITLFLTEDATGSRTWSFASAWKPVGGSALTFNTAASKKNFVSGVYNSSLDILAYAGGKLE